MLPNAERAADQFRGILGPSKLPVDPWEVADVLGGIEILEMELDGDGHYVDLGFAGAQIFLKKSAPPARKRFTLAHELGHHFLLSHSQTSGLGKRNFQVEKWCNGFAAALLMPRKQVLESLRGAKKSGLVKAIADGPRNFGVSVSAFRSRVAEVSPVSIIGIRNVGGEIKIDYNYSNDKKSVWKSEYDELREEMENEESIVRSYRDATVCVAWVDAAVNEEQELLFALIGQSAEANRSKHFS